MITVLLNGVSVAYKPGIVIKEKLNKDLDVGTIVIPQTTELSIEPKDQVVISNGDDFTKYMLVSDIIRTTSRYHTPKEYNYTLNLVSPTIQLQRIVLPNRSITQPLTGAKTDIYTMISRYVELYAPNYTISSALETLTTGVDCPEFQWNRPTLFEVLNDMLLEVDAVVTMTNFTTISYLNLNPVGSTIDDLELGDVILEQNIMEYANKVEVEVENAIQNSVNTRVIEWLNVKTDEDAIVTTNNAKLILDKPIERINKIVARYAAVDVTFTVYEADITDYVVPKSKYDLLDPINSPGYVEGDYKRSYLYFEEESNIIDGVCFQESTWIPAINSKIALLNVFRNAYKDATGVDIGANLANDDILKFVFKVDYQAIDTVKLISKKKNALKNDGMLINNQDTSYVDFLSFAKKQQNTTDRIGHPRLTISGKYESYSNIPSLGDNYETDFKLSEREFALYDTYVNFKGILNKYYVLKELYSGLKNQRRFTQIAASRESFESNHITECNLEFSTINSSEKPTLENHMLKFAQTDENIRLVMLRFFNDSGVSKPIGVSPSTYHTDKSVILTYKLYDNYSAGFKSIYHTELLNNYIDVRTVPYVDSNGRFNWLSATFYKKYVIPKLNLETLSLSTDWNDGLEISRKLPEIDIDYLDSADLVHSYSAYRYKDNREITVETYQFNFETDSNIFLGYKFFEDNPLRYSSDADKTLYVSYSTTLTYEDGEQTAKGTIAALADLIYTITDNSIVISSPSGLLDISEFASWAICDSSANIYIAHNGNNSTIYLNHTEDEFGEEVVIFLSNSGSLDTDYSIPYRLRSFDFETTASLEVETDILNIYRPIIEFENEGTMTVAIKVIDVEEITVNMVNEGSMNVTKKILNVYPVAIEMSNTGTMPMTATLIDVVNVTLNYQSEGEMSLNKEVGIKSSEYSATDASGSLPYDYASWVDEGGLSYFAGTLFDPDDYSLGDVLMVDVDWARGLWREGELTPDFNVTVGLGDGLNISAILSAVQSQIPALYNDWGTYLGGILRVNDTAGYTYYKITQQYVYVEITYLEK
jgi:hypothetical protein